jgi:hypothetical protein
MMAFKGTSDQSGGTGSLGSRARLALGVRGSVGGRAESDEMVTRRAAPTLIRRDFKRAAAPRCRATLRIIALLIVTHFSALPLHGEVGSALSGGALALRQNLEGPTSHCHWHVKSPGAPGLEADHRGAESPRCSSAHTSSATASRTWASTVASGGKRSALPCTGTGSAKRPAAADFEPA